MASTSADMGRLVSTRGVSGEHLQRSAIMIALSLLFFFATIFAFILTGSFLSLALAAAFLIIFFFSVYAVVTARRHRLKIFENGVEYRNAVLRWSEVDAIGNDMESMALRISGRGNETISLPPTLQRLDEIETYIRGRTGIGN